MALLQCDWCPYKREIWTERQTGVEGGGREGTGRGRLATSRAHRPGGIAPSWPLTEPTLCPHLDLGRPALGDDKPLRLEPQPVGFCYTAPADRHTPCWHSLIGLMPPCLIDPRTHTPTGQQRGGPGGVLGEGWGLGWGAVSGPELVAS